MADTIVDEATETAALMLERAASTAWRGSDPYDGLWWNWPAPLRGGRRRRQALMQIHARSPIDLRRLYRRERPLIPKALGIFASVGIRLHQLTGDQRHADLAEQALRLLEKDRAAGAAAWGYHWDMQTRWSFYAGGSPNVVVTSFGANALAEAGRALGLDGVADRARRAAAWVLDELFLSERGFYVYHPGSTVLIHNANLLGAALTERLVSDPRVRPASERSVAATLAGQSDDGSFPYGEGSRLKFVDSFHTGYVLGSLCELSHVDPAADAAVRRGARYYVDSFFGADGAAKLWPDRAWPIDAHAAGTGLTTLATLLGHGHVDPEPLRRVARQTAEHVVRDGRAVPRFYRWGAVPVRYIRWSDAHVALGLANAALALRDQARSAGR